LEIKDFSCRCPGPGIPGTLYNIFSITIFQVMSLETCFPLVIPQNDTKTEYEGFIGIAVS
jgi:hypothetical protein